ncbi:MAG TPA: PAS domain-containing protein, partial [Candidatus Sabulitectum sp.]|nr:PAS domain-containing protein [Candidatus Sabulitectum sp.]
MNSGSFSTSLVLELSVLQEISSLRDSGTVEKLVEEVSEKASRLLGCRRFALILFEGETRRLAGTWGITDLSSIDAIIESGGKNVFIQDFTLDNERRGTVVFEQAKPMDAKQKRLYTLLAGRMKEIIRSIQAREQKQAAEKELSNSKTFFDNILNSVEDGIMVLDEDFSIKYCNRIVQNWLSERINLHSNKCHQLFNSLDAPCEECPAAASLSSGKPERSLIRGIKGSEVEWVEAFASPLLTEAGEFSGTVVSIRDISLQKKLEEDLYQIRKLEAVNTLTTGVAHEFNNILQAVIGYSEFIMSRMEDSDRFYNDIAQIHDFGLSGSALINKIMAFSRKSDVELTTVDLNRRVAHTSDMLLKTIPKMVRIEQVTDS